MGQQASTEDTPGRPRCSATIVRTAVTVALVAVLLATGPLTGRWRVDVETPDGGIFIVDAAVLRGLVKYADDEGRLPLEPVLWQAGQRAVEQLVAVDPDGKVRRFEWPTVADDAWWSRNGRVSIAGETITVSRLEIEPPALLAKVQAEITDIAPTVAAVLGIPAPARATGRALDVPAARRVVLLLLDGFGYVRASEATAAGLIPNLAALGEPLVGLTVYPPATRVATAALLTGTPPGVSGVEQRDMRQTEAETLFDVASRAGLEVVAVEGESLPFELRNAEVRLSGDRDGNGSTDDNVLSNALAVLETSLPAVLYVHLHGIDDTGHTYGHGAPEEEAAIQGVDAAVGRMIETMAKDTLVIVLADHGQHHVNEEGRLGNHEFLIERDVFIPIWITRT
jgi:hypothetical protein